MYIPTALLGIFSLLACAACEAGSPFGSLGRQDLLLILPSLPPAWAELPDLRMALTWRGPGGLLRSALVEPGARLRVEVDRGRPQAILALPSSAGRGLRPAGAIYPGNAGGQLALDWRGGYEASLALALLGGGVDPWLFNLGRLVDEALARCGDPWLLPVLDVAQALADRSFRIDLYRRMPSFALRLPGIGSWAPESPFAPAPVGEGEGSTVTLGEGLWRFLGPSEELLVSVDAEGGAVFVRRPSPGP